jgi:hypothetical protein
MLFVDGTFNLVEGNMVLTTIMVLVGKVGVPVAWLLCNCQTQDYYLLFQVHEQPGAGGHWAHPVTTCNLC